MDTVGDATEAGQQPGKDDAPARSGRSGEGARSVLEHLQLQEKKMRDAQLAREPVAPPAPTHRA